MSYANARTKNNKLHKTKKWWKILVDWNYNIRLKVATVAGAVHAALGKFYEILWSRKTRSQTCNVMPCCSLIFSVIGLFMNELNQNVKKMGEKLTKFISLSSNFGSNVSRYLSDVGKRRVNQTLIIVFLTHLGSQSLRCDEGKKTVKLSSNSETSSTSIGRRKRE